MISLGTLRRSSIGLFCSTSSGASPPWLKVKLLNNAYQPIMLLTFSTPDREGTSLVHHVISNASLRRIGEEYELVLPR